MFLPIRGAVLACALLLGLRAHAAVLDPPTLRCASVGGGGNVTLTWTPPSDPNGDFAEYEVWHASGAGGPFTLLATIASLGQTTFFHAGANAGNGPQYYYMVTVSSGAPPNESVPSDTIATMYLQVFQSAPLGNANLSWNDPAPSATVVGGYTVWLEYPIGTWSVIATLAENAFAYQWPVSICEDTLTFRVSRLDGSGCTAFSNRDGGVFRDVTPPSVPVIAAVSVDQATGLSTITWSPSPEPDTQGYIIVWNGPGGAVIIDTLYGQASTVYPWPDSWPSSGSESFTIAAFDSCLTGTPPSPNTSATGPPHATMFLSDSFEPCALEVTLNWTAYVGWAPLSQQVLGRMDGGAWSLLATIPGTATQWIHSVLPGHTYCYVVRAERSAGGAFSLSNEVCRFADAPPPPGTNYLRTVTVVGPSSIMVVDSVDAASNATAYRIERSVNGGPYVQVASVPGSAGPVFSWVDNRVRTDDTGYRYRVVVDDDCGRPAFISNIGGSIVLRAVPELGGTNRLEWNGYIQWAGVVGGYAIYRSVADGPFELFALVPPDPWTYTDTVNAFSDRTGRFCYFVEALEAGNPSGIDAVSRSNEACAAQEDLVFIPNAFIVGSAHNPVFKPVLGFVDVAEYRLLIINRWGQIVWESQDPNVGWNGVIGSQVMPMGVYGYYCTVRSGEGRRVEKHGTVTLLKADD
jgi:hypothetical protein